MSASSVALNTVETGRLIRTLARVRRRGPTSPFGDCLKIEPKPGGQSLIRLRAFLNFASKRGVGAGAGVKLAGHDPLFLRLLINRALTKSPRDGHNATDDLEAGQATVKDIAKQARSRRGD